MAKTRINCATIGCDTTITIFGQNRREADRKKDFLKDPAVPAECQQTSTKSYGQNYDRGHQVPANHLDSSALAIAQTNFMTNILPQTKELSGLKIC